MHFLPNCHHLRKQSKIWLLKQNFNPTTKWFYGLQVNLGARDTVCQQFFVSIYGSILLVIPRENLESKNRTFET